MEMVAAIQTDIVLEPMNVRARGPDGPFVRLLNINKDLPSCFSQQQH